MRFNCSGRTVVAITTTVLVLTAVASVAVAFSLVGQRQRRGGADTSSKSSKSSSLHLSTKKPLEEEEDRQAIDEEEREESSRTKSIAKEQQQQQTRGVTDDDDSSIIRVAFLGNSILYFNDCPRLVQHMLSTRFGRNKRVDVDSCLRPNASLATLWTDGSGMYEEARFRSGAAAAAAACSQDDANDGDYWGSRTVPDLLLNKPWDFVVMNDHTRAPVREPSKQATKQALSDHYADLFLLQQQQSQQEQPTGKTTTRGGACEVILLQTAAYRDPKINDSADLGEFEEFSSRLQIGYTEYAQFLKTLGVKCRIAPFGQAVRYLHHHNHQLWLKTYSWDGYHPSPHGTWLMACVLYLTLMMPDDPNPPPLYRPEWFQTCRYFHTSLEHAVPQPLPSDEEAFELRRVAMLVCSGSSSSSTGGTPDKRSKI